MKTVPLIKSFLHIHDFVYSKKKTKMSKAKINRLLKRAVKYQSAGCLERETEKRNKLLRKSNEILTEILMKIEEDTEL